MSGLNIPFKTSPHVDCATPLGKYITATYGKKALKSVQADLNAFNQARNENRVMSSAASAGDGNVAAVLKYMAELRAVQSRFPVGDHNVRLSVTWNGAWQRSQSTTVNDLNLEKAAVMFNLGALYSKLAAQQPQSTVEGRKVAKNYFQRAAGVFAAVKATVAGHIAGKVTPDLEAASLDHCVNLSLAQAQECFCQLAIQKGMQDGTVAKLTNAAALYYDVASSQVSHSKTLTSTLGKTWLATVEAKAHYWNAVTSFRRAEVVLAQRKASSMEQYGLEVALLRDARNRLDAAAAVAKKCKLSALANEVSALLEQVAPRLATSEEDNRLIYHDPVPEALPELEQKKMVKAEPMPPLPSVADPWEQLVPTHIRKAAEEWRNLMPALIKHTKDAAGTLDMQVRSGLGEMSLPEAVLASEGGGGLPEELMAKVTAVQEESGLQALYDLRDQVIELGRQDREMIQEAMRQLMEEEQEDAQNRANLAGKWTRQESRAVNADLMRRGNAYQNKIHQADHADKIIAKKIEDAFDGLQKLGWTSQKLVNWVPRSAASASPALQQRITAVKTQLSAADALIAKRAGIITELETAADGVDIVSILLKHADTVAAMNVAKAVLRPVHNRVEATQTEQIDVMGALRAANGQFVAERSSQSGAVQREQALKEVEDAVTIYHEVKENITEGINFYSRLQSELAQFCAAANDFVTTRSAESSQLLSNLTRQFGEASLGAAPAEGMYYSNAAGAAFGGPSPWPAPADSSAGPPPPADSAYTAPSNNSGDPYAM